LAVLQRVAFDARVDGSDVRRWCEEKAIPPDTVRALRFEFDRQAGDFGASLAVVVLGNLGAHIAKQLWDEQVRPRLRSEHGKDVGDASDLSSWDARSPACARILGSSCTASGARGGARRFTEEASRSRSITLRN
jgi:hypothetical protein